MTVLALILSPLAHVAMRAADGDLDPTFGNGSGLVTIDFGTTNALTGDMVVQADGKILLVGEFSNTPGFGDFMLLRLIADGTLDPSFGTGGQVRTDFAGAQDAARAVAVQPDGKIVVAGVARTSFTDSHFGVARYNPDGSLDTTFDGDGKVVTTFAPKQALLGALSVAIQHDGKIVAVGTVVELTGGKTEIALARYNTDGSLDPSFDDDGRVITDINPAANDGADDVLIDSHGRIVVVGSANGAMALVGYTDDGSLDASFGQGGIVTTPFPQASSSALAGELLADGRIVVAGGAADLAGNHFALARYDDTGALDVTFGTNGIVVTDFAGGNALAFSLAIQRDGKIVAAGSSSGRSSFVLVRYEAEGSLDATFGIGGTVTTNFDPASSDGAAAVAIQRDGKIVAAGSSVNGTSIDVAVARYEGVPPPHTLTFFLHGLDVPGTATGFTMNQTAPAKSLFVNIGKGARWFSDPVVDGTFVEGSAFEVVLPCTLGLSLPKSVHLASTDAAGQDARPLGQASTGLRFCQTQTIAIPVTTPAALENRRLKLTISSVLPIELLRLGNQTFLRATNFAGVP